MQPNPAIAIVGSGPAGCYLAQTLRRSMPDAEITMFDRLASPFGLVRYGVAPDHQGTKSIQAQFARLFERDNVRFAGNVEVGSKLSLDALRDTHHVVVLATGLARDRALRVPGESLSGVYGAGQFTRTMNTHPHENPTLPLLGDTVAIIGGGNVSLDVVRLLIKSPADFDGSDVNDPAVEAYAESPVREIDLICRSSADAAPFDPSMLAELGRIPGVQFASEGQTLSGANTSSATQSALEGLRSSEPDGPPRVRVRIHFNSTTTRIAGKDRVEGVEIRLPDGSLHVIEARSVITAVGFDFDPSDPLLGEMGANSDTGLLAEGLYRTGWAKRGSRGTIPENRQCAKAVAAEILKYLAATQSSAPKAGYSGLPDATLRHVIDFEGWLRVDAAERAAAPPNRSRKKFADHSWMVATAHENIDGQTTSAAQRRHVKEQS
ncbi:ferredoxin--NADP+ reductase [Arthrobacter sp. cf158]|uniref:FAD-dependent oxidoreductase n=1 Tax=Arthrobacter sp. cf158 TaxID=1761744 RepID=UPI000899F2AC|nr:FAD-dependent oxidoreductase [Arthrobacter sp. cf158]SDW90896.1 ferredoxin--NADP+ reductase [Arthrobacter sp. cf158]